MDRFKQVRISVPAKFQSARSFLMHVIFCRNVLMFFCARLQMAGHPSGVCWKPGRVVRGPVCCHLQGLLGQRPGWPVYIHRSQRQWPALQILWPQTQLMIWNCDAVRWKRFIDVLCAFVGDTDPQLAGADDFRAGNQHCRRGESERIQLAGEWGVSQECFSLADGHFLENNWLLLNLCKQRKPHRD